MTMALRDEVLAPIPGANPGGVELRYDPLYDKIKEARREDEDIPQGEWQTTRKTADWGQVIKLTKEALTTKSKDLQLAVWLAEAMLRREGFAGFRSALDMIVGLLDGHWEHLHPELEDGDAEMRAAPLEWLGIKLDLQIKRVALNRAGQSWLQHQEARTVPTEADASADSAKAETRQAYLTEGKTTPEDIERGFQSTPKAWLKSLVAEIDGTLESLQNLDDISQERFAEAAPSYSRLRGSIEEVQRTARQLLKRKLELEPDVAESTAAEPPLASATTMDSLPVVVPANVVLPGSFGAQLAPQPTSREDAASRIAAVAKYLRQSDPTSPAPYLMVRGFRWGELRASGRDPDPRLLEAPPTPVRTQLKSLLLDGKWDALLEACEAVMATPNGRGWLDLQRYALTACERLGSEFAIVASALRGALRSLLLDVPGLIDMTLMDDTPTANAETRVWLKGIVESDVEPADLAAPSITEPPRGRDLNGAAIAAVRGGRTDRAIASLMREVGGEKSKRGRFLLQTQLANIMVEANHHAVAQPILDELLGHVEAHKLEDWEAGEVVARPLALLYRCLEKLDGDASARQALYLRICRLDPLQAMSFAQAGEAGDEQT